ncbi:ATP-binding protein [Herbaspirillum rubrisubalbicans]|uniref:ATP-binding protein n=1 Tax=Herbaspirillum rubrisubalbicans TaxID=80842 RepID=A0ABX9BXN5_9BURK|nr:helicase HerA-like C-terminal domain-containing protein [Herbaspirillum rubrisubalbicans]RAM62652.1 ATP-binding protein [Herbaspirillum rubrisubalbicans]RAN43189.1 ATP-binding protein [Herbaspirillum rubrisubalbicans]
MINPLPIASHPGGLLCLLPQLANRHGCITGATGTGKTVTLQVLAQALSDIGVPVFMADVKGDLSGLGKAGSASPKTTARLAQLGLPEPAWAAAPVAFWDVYGQQGHPVRATISDMGPLMLARMLNLNDTQQGVLQLVFKIADDHGLLLLDTKDLRAMLQHVGENAAQFKTEYGNISAASVGAIQRGLIAIDEQGGDQFFGEPMLNIEDWMQTDAQGRGVINILAADKLMNAPRLYSTFLLWMLSELFEHLPEVGDLDKPKMAFFFDEAHLLFDEAPKPLLQKIEQVVRLIRSKGVGIYFVTQNPLDIPDTVLGQLGNRVQHALRAYTPRDQKAVQAAAETFRPNPMVNTAQAITELGVGEALVSFLDDKGRPNMVERGYVLTPASQIGPLSAEERRALIASSLVAGVYEQAIDRESAYERLKGRAVQQPQAAPAPTPNQPSAPAPAPAPAPPPVDDNAWGASAGHTAPAPATSSRPSGGARMPSRQPQPQPQAQPLPQQDEGGGLGDLLKDAAGGLFGSGNRRSDSPLQAMVKSAARSIGSQVGRELIRGVLGSLMKKR